MKVALFAPLIFFGFCGVASAFTAELEESVQDETDPGIAFPEMKSEIPEANVADDSGDWVVLAPYNQTKEIPTTSRQDCLAHASALPDFGSVICLDRKSGSLIQTR